ncbi:MAG: hypothetical protein HY554_19020 [Elusimicrobia bacterium]|nr:hypothetical protein [Elusimicrobiota bacterium]
MMTRQPDSRGDDRWQFPALTVAIVIAVFGGYELIERTLLLNVEPALLRTLHMIRGVSAAIITAGAAVWWFRREPARVSFSPSVSVFTGSEGIGEQLSWFVGMRWLAAGLATIMVFASQHVLDLLAVEVTPFLWLGCAALWLSNLAFARSRTEFGDLRSYLLWLVLADLLILTHLLHFSGGLENPLFPLYTFHVIIAGILLPSRDAYGVSAAVGVLFLALAFGEYSRLVPHYAISLFPHELRNGEIHYAAHELPFVLGRTGAFLILLGGTTFFTTTIMERLRASHRQLLHAEKLSALGQLVAYVAHEVNNPIGIISTRMKLARSGEREYGSPEFIQETLEIVDRQADRVGTVVRSLLNLSKPHHQPIAAVDINETLSEALYLISARLAHSGIAVEERLAEGLPGLESRRNDLLHIFLNILNNAIDAMPDGGRLAVSSRRDNGRLVVGFADTGCGIAAGAIDHIFEPLYTTKSRAQGTGLGLSVSLALARSLGGDIRVESVRGKGTTFHVRLPLGA